jgi:hypothetical protein
VDNGGNVELTDTGQNFTGLAQQDVVRILPVRVTGTVTGSGSGGATLEDNAATFISSGVLTNDLVRTATCWARVTDAPISETRLPITGWRDRTTYRPCAYPATATAYTIYRTLVGHRTTTGSTSTVIRMGTTFPGISDMLGNDITGAPPVPNGTLYEVTTVNPNYQIQAEANVNGGQIDNVTVIGGWADQIGIFGDEWTITNLRSEEGQDGGLTLTGNRNTVVGGSIRRNGTVGLYFLGLDNLAEAVQLQDNVWVNGVNTTSLADIQCTQRGIIAGCTTIRTGTQPQSRFGVVFGAASVGCRIAALRSSGHATREVEMIAGATGAICDGVPCGTVGSVACATTNPGIRYFDTNLLLQCFCNGQGTPRYCRDDTGACGSTTTDCG